MSTEKSQRTLYTGKISDRYKQAKLRMRQEHRNLRGLRFIFHIDDHHEVFPKGSKETRICLDNLDQLPEDAFEVYTSMGDEIVVKQTRHLPLFHLV